MTNEEMQSTIQFILEQQAQFSVNMEALRESQLEQQAQFSVNMEALRESQARTDKIVQALATQVEQIARQQAHINDVVAVIADAQQHTDERLNALINIVQGQRDGSS
jgi:acetolactate synthase small subunit